MFQETLERILNGLSGVSVYLDDIIVTGGSVPEHNTRLRAVLDRLKKHNVALAWEKCEIGQITGHPLPAVPAPRRSGDPARLTATSARIRSELGWVPDYPDLHTIIETAWRWHRKQQHERQKGDGIADRTV